MTVQNLSAQPSFITKDGSTIRSILDRTNAPVQNQSLADASVPAGARHYHKIAEEFYFIFGGEGDIEIDGEHRAVGPGDAILIPPGARHTIAATKSLRFLCCCAPPIHTRIPISIDLGLPMFGVRCLPSRLDSCIFSVFSLSSLQFPPSVIGR